MQLARPSFVFECPLRFPPRRPSPPAHAPLCALPCLAPPRLALQHKFEEKYGPTWHVVVGEDFKAAITHESKTFFFVSVGKSNVLLYRCG